MSSTRASRLTLTFNIRFFAGLVPHVLTIIASAGLAWDMVVNKKLNINVPTFFSYVICFRRALSGMVVNRKLNINVPTFLINVICFRRALSGMVINRKLKFVSII